MRRGPAPKPRVAAPVAPVAPAKQPVQPDDFAPGGPSMVNSDFVCDARDALSLKPVQHSDIHFSHSDDHVQALKNIQIVLVVDRSGSMLSEDDDASGKKRSQSLLTEVDYWTRWDNCWESANYLARSFFRYDKDGKVPVIFFDCEVEEVTVRSVEELSQAFKNYAPRKGTTNMLQALQRAVSYVTEEPTLFIVYTDGEANEGQKGPIEALIGEKVVGHDHLLLLRMGDDQKAIDFLEFLDNSKVCGRNVDTKSDNAMYAMGSKNLLLNALFEHIEEAFAEQDLR